MHINEQSKGNKLHNRLEASGKTARLLTIVYSNDSFRTGFQAGQVQRVQHLSTFTFFVLIVEFPAGLFCTYCYCFHFGVGIQRHYLAACTQISRLGLLLNLWYMKSHIGMACLGYRDKSGCYYHCAMAIPCCQDDNVTLYDKSSLITTILHHHVYCCLAIV